LSSNQEKESTNWTLQLPDELVIKILSGLTLKEAVRTSVISKRWINLWKSADLVLDFDYINELLAIWLQRVTAECNIQSFIDEERRRFKNWVSRVVSELEQHDDELRIIKFRVAFTDQCCSKGEIDRWIKFAISKRVEFLDLSFTLPGESRTSYVFPEDCYNHIKTTVGLSQIKSLRSLRLSSVDIREEILEHFIANCPLLEELSLSNSKCITKIRVVGSSHSMLQLKRLEVRKCLNVRVVEIDHVPHLEKLVYDNGNWPLEKLMVGSNCSSLVDLTLSSHENVRFVSGCASQLRILSLNLSIINPPFSGLVEHARLEQLNIKASGFDNESILGLIPLINQCPRLHTLKVDFLTPYERFNPVVANVDKRERENIKVVEITGFRGCFREREFVEYMIQYFIGLERIKIVIDWNQCTEDDVPKVAVLKFKSKASPAVEFVVI
ncbi:Putative F-box/LRR-repeat protein At5g25860, partial [Linum perenne]